MKVCAFGRARFIQWERIHIITKHWQLIICRKNPTHTESNTDIQQSTEKNCLIPKQIEIIMMLHS